jgi:hypothetical protein
MSWTTGIVQDRDGYWVEVALSPTFNTDLMGPFMTADEAKAAELRARLELHRIHGPHSR